MKQVVTIGIVLSRREFGEADRILSVITPDAGKVRLIAKGVRRPLSKLAGGIELFSVSNFTYLPGKSGLGTLLSSRLIKHYGRIVNDLDRTMFGYELLKIMEKSTEDVVGEEYFDLLNEMLMALDDPAVSTELIELVFSLQLLEFSGHSPNLQSDIKGRPLQPNQAYGFDFERMGFTVKPNGRYSSDHIKLLRLSVSGRKPANLQKISGLERLIPADLRLIHTIRQQYLRV